MTTAKPLARYGAIWQRAREQPRYRSELHHHPGRDQGATRQGSFKNYIGLNALDSPVWADAIKGVARSRPRAKMCTYVALVCEGASAERGIQRQ
jgi:hypothetical protein